MSHVRLPRVLSESEHPLPPGELARASRLNLSGVLRAIDRLAQLGIVRAIGAGGRRVIDLSPTHAFAPVLRTLFEAERQRRRILIASLQELMKSITPAPRAAWIEGPHASGMDSAHDALRLGVLTTVRERHAIAEQLTGRLRDIGRRFDLTIDLLVRTRADLETMAADLRDAVRGATLLYGVLPLSAGASHPNDDEPPAAKTHEDLHERSREQAERVAKAITRDQRLIDAAQRWVQQRLKQASAAEAHELREWEHILTLPPHRIAAFLRDPGEVATRLRQTTPFVGVVSDGERGARQ